MTPTYYSTTQAATYLAVSPWLIRQLVDAGELRCARGSMKRSGQQW